MEFIGSIISEAMKNGYITTEALLLLLNGLVIVGSFFVHNLFIIYSHSRRNI
jgi:hypothetical protein